MLKTLQKIFLVLAVFSFLFPVQISAQELDEEKEPVEVQVYYSETCPHCKEERGFLNDYNRSNPGTIKIVEFEVSSNQENAEKLQKVAESFGESVRIPYTIVGGSVTFRGYDGNESTGKQIVQAIESCYENTCESEMPVLITIPLVGVVDVSSFSIPVLTIVIGLLDGFNPCAMWVLLFLITLLLGMKNHTKRWVLGLAFILTSGFVYFLFLAAWLQVYNFLGVQNWLIVVVGIVAIVSGILNLRKYWKQRKDDGGCEVVEGEKRRNVFEKMKKVTASDKFWVALIGIIALAVSVNLIELVCSAGLPAIYTGVLNLSNLNPVAYYGYLLLYILMFMLDDLVIFAIAMFTLKTTGISTRYSKYSSLIGGIIILLIGIVLLVKPELLMMG